MSSAMQIAAVVASVNNVEPTTQKKLYHFYPEIVRFELNKFSNDETIAEMDSLILRYTQPTSMTPMQYAGVQYAKS